MRRIIILFFVLALGACGKKTAIKGRIYNPVTNEGIPGVEVILKKRNGGIPMVAEGSGSKEIEKMETDASGRFALTERLGRKKDYDIMFMYDDKLYHAIEGTSKQIAVSDNNKEIDWPLVPTAYIKYHIKNIDCQNASDRIQIMLLDGLGEYAENDLWKYDGCEDFESPEYLNILSGKLYFHWIVTKNNAVTHHYDTIYLAPFEQRYYEILY